MQLRCSVNSGLAQLLTTDTVVVIMCDDVLQKEFLLVPSAAMATFLYSSPV